jgi:hypothetical protein
MIDDWDTLVFTFGKRLARFYPRGVVGFTATGKSANAAAGRRRANCRHNHAGLKKILVIRADLLIFSVAHFRTCLWSCVDRRGSGQEAG